MSYQLNDFAFDLRASLAPSNHIWVGSGYSTVAPLANTVAGVKGLFSPPFAARDVQLLLNIEADGHQVSDTGNLGKGDCGLLFAGAEWRPDRIARSGTYHYFHENRLISLFVSSRLVPLSDQAGFVVSVKIMNRTERSIEVSVLPELSPGRLNLHPLDDWDYGHPAPGEVAHLIREDVWENEKVRMTLYQEGQKPALLGSGEEAEFRVGVVLTRRGEATMIPQGLAAWEKWTESAWQDRIDRLCGSVPRLDSDIPGLKDYYLRSLVSGLICLWEHPDFAMQPFPVVSGIEGAGICCYPWDTGGYAGRLLSLMIGSDSMMELAKLMANSGIEAHSRFSPSGVGKDVPYAYSLWSFFNLIWSNVEQHGEGLELYDNMRKLLLSDEDRLPAWGELLDYGQQHNLLEMRSAAHEHVVSSPNAERAWCYDRLADLAERLNNGEAKAWRNKAEQIRREIREQLWDEEAGWFVCRYPDGHLETVYTIQAFDTLRMGVCTESMKTALLSHLREGAFLAPYGVSSISAEDKIHYELNDPDWSGGGSYTGEATILALTMWEIGEAGLAWDVLKRLLWMGCHLPYFPQEHYCDRPAVPAHKRANVIAGLSGAEAVLFGMVGLKPGANGILIVEPQPPLEGSVSITGYPYRGRMIDVHMQPGFCKIVCDGMIVHEGPPTRCIL
ncbi:MGH1-like glycoside hydrolase domain-containing protein [Cohnella sp. 56]|uniref:MGH1-like glycoside hydrolase domain-containing protein n=1 Tax=Cohnella sp. 56 TaxID=3113722 RepID=UPI0030E81917